MAHPVVHWEIAAKDAAKLNSFYHDLFGWQIDSAMPGYGLVAGDPPGIGGGIMQTEGDMPPYVAIYVSVEDLDAMLAQAQSLGGTPVVQPREIPGGGMFAMFADPEGHMIGLFKERT